MAIQNADMSNAQNPLSFYLDAIRQLIEMGFPVIEDGAKYLAALDRRTQAGYANEISQYLANYNSAKNLKLQGLISADSFQMSIATAQAGLFQVIKTMPSRLELNARLGQGEPAFQFSTVRSETFDRVMEAFVGDNKNLYKISWVENALKYSKAVCQIVTPTEKGTGFLTEDGYLFTNHHVLKTIDDARGSKAVFNFRSNADGTAQPTKAYELDADSYYSNEDLDYAYVRVRDRVDAPLDKWGFVQFDTEAPVNRNDILTIIQHAGGNEMQIGLDANKTLSIWSPYVFYDTPTLPGSSGSPVFNQQWKVVALHHAGFENDTVINAQGDKRPANRGILFSKIFDDLRAAGKTVPV